MKSKIVVSTMLLSVSVLLWSCTEQLPTSTEADDKGSLSNRVINQPGTGASVYILRDDLGRPLVPTAADTIKPLFAHEALGPSHVRGARIYDDYSIELGIAPLVDGLAALADNPAAIGGGGLCSDCHGYDYEGTSTFSGAEVNLQDLIPVRGRDEEWVIHMLQDGFMLSNGATVHNFGVAGGMRTQSIVDVADFVVNEIYDTHQVLSAATGVALGDMAEGLDLYTNAGGDAGNGVPAYIRADGTPFSCSLACHDVDAGVPTGADLKASALADPFRFLHRTNFGSPRDVVANGFGYGNPLVMPGLYEVVLTDGLHFGGPEQAAAAMRHVQMMP